MSDGLSLIAANEMDAQETQETHGPCLNSFALWIELQPISTHAGLLELIGNDLYRYNLYHEGGEVKHIAQLLRERV